MPPQSRPPWQGEVRLAIGKALAEADEGAALTASQLADEIGKHQSNLKRAAEELVEEGILETVEPPAPNGQPGRRPHTAFAFADGERERFERVADVEVIYETPTVGTQLVFVESQGEGGKLWKILSQRGVTSGLAAGFQLEGDRPEMMFAFQGPGAVEDSLDFLEILKEAELKARRHVVTKSSSGTEIRNAARRRTKRVNRSREQLGSMQTAPRAGT